MGKVWEVFYQLKGRKVQGFLSRYYQEDLPDGQALKVASF